MDSFIKASTLPVESAGFLGDMARRTRFRFTLRPMNAWTTFRPLSGRCRAARWVVAWLAVSVLAGCSLLSLAYNRLPTIAYWRLDAMLDLNTAQSALVRQELDRWHAWHRREHLPRYAQALTQWQAQMVQDATPAQVCVALDQLRQWAREASQQALPLAVRLAPTLSEPQLQHWQRHQLESEAEFRADFMSTNGAVAPKRLRRATERVEMIYGALNAEQRAWWHERLRRSAFDPQRSLVQRQQRFADWTGAVRRIQAGAGAEGEVQQAWLRVWQPDAAADAAERDALQQGVCAQLAELHNRTTPAQRVIAQQKLQSFAADFLTLAGQGL